MISGLDTYRLVEEAIREAKRALEEGEVPVGAVVVGRDGEILGKGHNSCLKLKDPTAHAEILAIREACGRLKNYRLTDCSIICTLEPCWMCFGAIMNARIGTLVYCVEDPEAGAISTSRGIHVKGWGYPVIIKGLERERCLEVLRGFFESKRRTRDMAGEVPKWS